MRNFNHINKRRTAGAVLELKEAEMPRLFKRFAASEDGAVSSDWVVLTAGIVLAVAAGMMMIRGQATASIAEIFTWVVEAEL